jgi:hypothetical protein
MYYSYPSQKSVQPIKTAAPMASCEDVTPEEIADLVIQELIQTNRWEELRVQLASILEVNGVYAQAKRKAQQILASEQLRTKMRQPMTTADEIATMVEKNGALRVYRNELAQLLTPECPTGEEIQKEIGQLADRYLRERGTQGLRL